ncbi:hypothetical protein TeGR_g2132 [Tetraparma gracilis]|uniref:Uncharacterized protein n=1 Tax=Tetraparma gracilis TaxID=2962635 RepID=A0ABQ6MRH3_9STRA|nr:hypothetical protein TeGR_g2132 [Tetraparma gracilis]
MLPFPPLLLLLFLFSLLALASAGYAPPKAPSDMPPDFCTDGKGSLTKTTGECMCKTEGVEGCKGSDCQCQYGLCWCHYKKKDCACV